MSKSSGSESHSTSLCCTTVKTGIDIDPDVHSIWIDSGWNLTKPGVHQDTQTAGMDRDWSAALDSSILLPLLQGRDNMLSASRPFSKALTFIII